MLTESIIDPTRSSLDPMVFNDMHVMKPEIRKQILDIIDHISRETGLSIGNIYVKGSILSYQWLDDTDIDILMETAPEMSDVDYERIKNYLKEYHDKETSAIGTDHPLQFYVVRGEYDRSRADGLYDLRNDEMILGPYDIEIDLDDYMQRFHDEVEKIDLTKAELKRDIIDYDIFNRLKDEDIADLENRINEKLKEINDSVEVLISQYNHLSDLRDNAFERDMSPEEIREYGSKNSLPDNVTFKLLERYHYIKFMKELKRMVKRHGEIDTAMDVAKVKSITF